MLLTFISSAGVNITEKYVQCVTIIIVQISAATIVEKTNPKNFINLPFSHHAEWAFATIINKYTQKQDKPPSRDGKRHRGNTANSLWNKKMTIFFEKLVWTRRLRCWLACKDSFTASGAPQFIGSWTIKPDNSHYADSLLLVSSTLNTGIKFLPFWWRDESLQYFTTKFYA